MTSAKPITNKQSLTDLIACRDFHPDSTLKCITYAFPRNNDLVCIHAPLCSDGSQRSTIIVSATAWLLVIHIYAHGAQHCMRYWSKSSTVGITHISPAFFTSKHHASPCTSRSCHAGLVRSLREVISRWRFHDGPGRWRICNTGYAPP